MDLHRWRQGDACRSAVACGRGIPWRGLLAAVVGVGLTVTGARLAAAERRLELDSDRSSIEVLVQANVGSFTGKLPAYDADIRVNPASGAVGRAVVNFTFADLRTGIALRDRHMREWEDTVR